MICSVVVTFRASTTEEADYIRGEIEGALPPFVNVSDVAEVMPLVQFGEGDADG